MALSLIRLEAEAPDLETVVKDIENAAKALKVPKDLVVHDEHYERVADGRYKGRRVFKRGAPPMVVPQVHTSITPTVYWGNTTASSAANPTVFKNAA